MDLTELCSIIPKQVFKDDEAVQMLAFSMRTNAEVHKDGKIFFGETEEQQKTIMGLINRILADVDKDMILWKGIYGDVEFWFFMHGVVIIRNLKQNQWMLASSVEEA